METNTNFADNIPKIEVTEEPVNQIDEYTLNSIIKQEPNDHEEDQLQNFTEEGELCVSGREVKEDDNEEEELELPERVFLVEQEYEDPLPTCSENSIVKTEWSAGEECDSTSNLSDWKCREVKTFEEGNSKVCQRGNNLTHESESQSVSAKSLTQSAHEMTNVQNARKSDRECVVCHKGFKDRAKLVKHMQTHKRPYECSVCQKGFSKRDHLVTHMRIHSGERPHECSVCEKSFATKGNLVKHVRIHSGERPYECSVCQKGFAERGALVTHVRIHSGERPHECSVCQKRFSDRGTLVRHMRIHTGERPYECPVCLKTYVHRCNLVTHMSVHKGE